jgi:4-amino-4-deoxy-L-arabinose transferase-like glycosyltransferase
MGNKNLLVVFFFLALYLLTAQGSIQTSDGMSMYLLTQSIAEHGRLSIESERIEILSKGRDDRYFSKYGLGQPLLAVPFYLAGVAIAKVSGIPGKFSTLFMVSLFNPVVASLVCLVLFLCALEIGFDRRTSLFLSFAYGISTTFWHYSQDFMSEPLTTLFFVAALYYVLKTASGSARNYIYSGFAIGCALVVRPASIVAVPVYLIYIFFKDRNSKKLFRNTCYFIGAFVPFMCVVLFYNYIRFGFIFDAGYQSHGFTTPLWTGLIGHLATPGKSIFLYNPFLLISAIGFYDFIRIRPKEALLVGLFFLFHLLLYSKWDVWTGGMTWGSRFLLVTFPYLILSSGFFLSKRGRTWWRISILLFCVGVIVQVPSLLANISRYHYTLRLQYKHEMMEQLIYNPMHSPIIGQWGEVVKVVGNLKKREYLERLITHAKDQKSFIGKGDEEVLNYGLALNVPNFWWVYLYLYGFPAKMILSIVVLLVATIFICGYKSFRLVAPAK